MEQPELIAIVGNVDQGGVFNLRRCYSTKYVKRWPEASSEYSLELVGQDGTVLGRTHPEVRRVETCEGGQWRWNLRGYIGFRESARFVRLSNRDLELWRTEVSSRPTLRVRLKGDANARKEPIELNIEFSRGNLDAHLLIVYQWGERKFQVLGQFAPSSSLKLDLSKLPGGPKCRLVVDYSNGVRSAGDATVFFPVESLGPELLMLAPADQVVLEPRQPLELIGSIVDPERNDRSPATNDLTWWVDEVQVGRGAMACLMDVAPGTRTVRLRYAATGTEVRRTVLVRTWEAGMPVPAADWPEFEEKESGR